MATTLRFLQFFALGTWVGNILFFSFVVAQGAFAVLPRQDMAGRVVNYSLTGLHLIGIAAGVIYLAATAAAEKSVSALAQPAAILVFVMVVLTVASQYGVIPRMEVLRAQMGSVAGAPAGSPLRAAFDRLHQYSVWIESVVLLSGLVALFLTARQRAN